MAGETQRIARLTPLTDLLGRIDALVSPAAPRRVATASALGRVLAEDVVAAAAVPALARALRDGFAVAAEAVSDASAYAPVPLMPPWRVDAGQALPAGADAVVPLDTVMERDGRFAALGSVASGDGVLAAGADVGAGAVLLRAGQVMRAAHVAALAAVGIGEIAVREPRVRVASARSGGDAVIAAAADLIGAAVVAAGGTSRRATDDLPSAFSDTDADAVVVVGGTGVGRNDTSVRALAAAGRVEVHGVALMPGETAAFGMVGQRPALLVPGRLDAALAVWLMLGRPMLARLSGCIDHTPITVAVLARKHASPLGMTEVVPVHMDGGQAEPIASGYWPLQVLMRAGGWILVPADSEGYRSGAEVVVRSWP